MTNRPKKEMCACGSERPVNYIKPGEDTATACIKCKQKDYISKTKRICKHCDSGKVPSFAFPPKKSGERCTECKLEGMINVSGRRCKNCDSGLQPSYGLPDAKTSTHCSKCRTSDMIMNRGTFCKCGSKKQMTFGLPDDEKPSRCMDCKKECHVDIRNSKCKCGSGLRMLFRRPDETKPYACSKCKNDGDINYGYKLCTCGSGSRMIYRRPDEITPYACFCCKKTDDINCNHAICKCGSNKRLSFKIPGTNQKFCHACKPYNVIYIEHKTCPGAINCPDDICPYYCHANPKYDDYCTLCFQQNFPDDPRTLSINTNLKELRVQNMINEHFEGFVHDRAMYTSHCDCTIKRRIDHRKLIGGTLLAIETDENQHASYDDMDEQTRYDDLYMAHSGKWVYIRFNPDGFYAPDGTRHNPALETRFDRLIAEINKQVERIEKEENTELVERVYLYYDGWEESV